MVRAVSTWKLVVKVPSEVQRKVISPTPGPGVAVTPLKVPGQCTVVEAESVADHPDVALLVRARTRSLKVVAFFRPDTVTATTPLDGFDELPATDCCLTR
jgi:hypothetical protein